VKGGMGNGSYKSDTAKDAADRELLQPQSGIGPVFSGSFCHTSKSDQHKNRSFTDDEYRYAGYGHCAGKYGHAGNE